MKNNKKKTVHTDELSKRISSEISKCVSFKNSVLAAQWQQNLRHYLAQPFKGDEKLVGKSKYISTETQHRVDWFTAQVITVLDGQRSIVSFSPTKTTPQSKAIAQQQTRVVDHVLRERNSHFGILFPWVKNAAMYGLGVVHIDFEEEVTEGRPEVLQGVTDEMLVKLTEQKKAGLVKFIEVSDDYEPEIPDELIDQAEQAIGQTIDPSDISQALPMVRDLTIRRIKSAPQFKITTVAVEDFIISKDADFCPMTGGINASVQGHRSYLTKQDLIEQGHDKKLVERIPTASDKTDLVAIERAAKTDYNTGISDAGDKIEVFEIFTKIAIEEDVRRDYRITVAGDVDDSPIVLHCEEVSKYRPYAALVPFPLPNTLFGQGIADRTGAEQELNSKIFRAMLNGLHYSVDPVKVVNTEMVNMDDVTNIHPGKVIRTEGIPGQSIEYNAPPFSGGAAMQVIDAITNRLDYTTGVGGQMVSIDASDLSDVTATAAKQRKNSQQMLIEQVCRHFSDTGYRYLAKVIIDLCVQKPELAQRYIQRLTNEYVPFVVDEWDSDMDVNTNITFGMMDKDYRATSLQILLGLQKEYNGIAATPANIHKTLVEVAETTGMMDAASYFTDPSAIPPPPPPPDPNAGLVQIEQVKAQLRSQSDAAEREFEAWKFRAQIDTQKDQMAQDLYLKAEEIRAKYAANVDIAKIQADQDRARSDVDWAIAEQDATTQRREQEAALRQHQMQSMQQPPMPPQGNM